MMSQVSPSFVFNDLGDLFGEISASELQRLHLAKLQENGLSGCPGCDDLDLNHTFVTVEMRGDDEI